MRTRKQYLRDYYSENHAIKLKKANEYAKLKNEQIFLEIKRLFEELFPQEPTVGSTVPLRLVRAEFHPDA